ncbi:MAG: HNH endonuclease signature motif containing protein [Nitrosotalea sp.]
MNKNLSPALKKKYFTLLIKRDGGSKCFYCEITLNYDSYIYDHLNNNRTDNRIENIVLACQSCNNKKPSDQNMQDKAMQKLKQNEESNFMREKMCENLGETSAEIEINTKNYDITEDYITREVNERKVIDYTNTLHSCVFICKQKTGHGSQQSVRNYISTLTSEVAPFVVARDENKKKVIAKREFMKE